MRELERVAARSTALRPLWPRLEVLANAKKSGRTLVVVHHDLTTAAEYFDRLILLKQRMYAYGPPERVLREDLLSEVYEGKLRVFADLRKMEGKA